mmetsp:Transcript_109681/g.194500  ORF Transcript_109681/g.194500 Transcript_109681/m.194500 type:complete len:174 (+) Transcript_109681:529-1050(+)
MWRTNVGLMTSTAGASLLPGLSGAAPVSPEGAGRKRGDASRVGGRRRGGRPKSSSGISRGDNPGDCSGERFIETRSNAFGETWPGGVRGRLGGVGVLRESTAAAGKVKEAVLLGDRSDPSEASRDGTARGCSLEADSGCPFHRCAAEDLAGARGMMSPTGRGVGLAATRLPRP